MLEVRNISYSYRHDARPVLSDVSFQIQEGEHVAILGANGAGKSTLVRMLNGSLAPTQGHVFLDGESVSSFELAQAVGLVRQDPRSQIVSASLTEEVAFGPRNLGLSQKEIQQRVAEALELCELEGLVDHGTTELSGGQQQRVAIARALVNEPQVLLLDEPLGALDLKLRKEMQLELKKIQKRLGITFIFVTHDQEEALTMSDTIVVMNKGKIQQMGSPEDIYNEPANAFVADFIGESNILDGIMLEDYKVKFADTIFKCVDSGFNPSEDIDVVIRPEDIEITTADKGMLTGKVNSVTFKGVHYEIEVITENNTWIIHNIKSATVGNTVGLIIDPESIHIMRKVKDYEKEK